MNQTEKRRDPNDGLRPWSAMTHGLGAVLSLVGCLLLLARAAGNGSSMWHTVSFAVFGCSLVWLYSASTLYHSLRATPAQRIGLRKLDHASIAVLIAGTYTPMCLVPLRGVWGWSLFGVIWALALANLFVCLFWIHSPRWVTSGIFLFMGWLAVLATHPLYLTVGARGLFWLLLGGALYTIGGVLYAVKWPGRNNPRFGCHEIFHVFILLGSVCHYVLVYAVIARLP